MIELQDDFEIVNIFIVCEIIVGECSFFFTKYMFVMYFVNECGKNNKTTKDSETNN
jgi:hypothetical protein